MGILCVYVEALRCSNVRTATWPNRSEFHTVPRKFRGGAAATSTATEHILSQERSLEMLLRFTGTLSQFPGSHFPRRRWKKNSRRVLKNEAPSFESNFRVFQGKMLEKAAQLRDLEYLFTVGCDADTSWMVLRQFLSDASTFTWQGVELNSLPTITLFSILSFINDQQQQQPKTESLRNLSLHLSMLLITMYRKKCCPHTSGFKYLVDWDRLFYNVLFAAIFPSNPKPTWKRIGAKILEQDMMVGNNFNSTEWLVLQIHTQIERLIAAVQSGDLTELKDAMAESSKFNQYYSPKFITSILFNNWSLLHFAAAAPAPSIATGLQIHPTGSSGTGAPRVGASTDIDTRGSAEFEHNTPEMQAREVFQYLLSHDIGCSVLAEDRLGQTPLHVAAANLNVTAVHCFLAAQPSAHKLRDAAGRTPLQLMLGTLSRCRWRRRVTSRALEELLRALLTPSSGHSSSNHSQETLWGRLALAGCAVEERSADLAAGARTDAASSTVGASAAAAAGTDPQSRPGFGRDSVFYAAVVHTDDHIADEVIKIARATHPTTWDVSAIQEAVLRCICQPNRSATVELLMKEMCPLTLGASLAFLDTCICTAMLYSKRAIKKDFTVLSGLLTRYAKVSEEEMHKSGRGSGSSEVSELASISAAHAQESGTGAHVVSTSTSAREAPNFHACFLYIAVLSGKPEIMQEVVRTVPKKLLKELAHDTPAQTLCSYIQNTTSDGIKSAPIASVPSNFAAHDWKNRLLNFGTQINKQAIETVFLHAKVSPVSLACILNLPEVLDVLLRYSFEAPTRSYVATTTTSALGGGGGDGSTAETVSSSSTTAASACGEWSEEVHRIPLMYCAQFGSNGCFQLFSSVIKKPILYQLCFSRTAGKLFPHYLICFPFYNVFFFFIFFHCIKVPNMRLCLSTASLGYESTSCAVMPLPFALKIQMTSRTMCAVCQVAKVTVTAAVGVKTHLSLPLAALLSDPCAAAAAVPKAACLAASACSTAALGHPRLLLGALSPALAVEAAAVRIRLVAEWPATAQECPPTTGSVSTTPAVSADPPANFASTRSA
jgi:hypothetical protein